MFGLVSFLSDRRLQVVLDGKSYIQLMNIQLMLEFSKAPFLFLHFSYYTLTIFLMISVILLSMLMILLTILSVSRHLIFGNNLNLLLNVNLIHETLDWGTKWLFDFSVWKTQLVLFELM